MPPDAAFCLIEDRAAGGALLYAAPHRLIVAHEPDELPEAFAALRAASHAGFHLAGFVSYECGYALEPRLNALLPRARGLPLLQFGAFAAPLAAPAGARAEVALTDLRAAWDFDVYQQKFAACRAYIEAGDIYQVNLTFPVSGVSRATPLELYRHLRARQPVELGGVVALGESTLISLSPERFFTTRGRAISVRPMKGTSSRGATPQEDRIRAQKLAADEKNRAENLMIVDLLRNDLSRLSEVGSVRVTDLFTVETFPTLHQMTSGVEAVLRPDLDFATLFASLFPCGSVTGAPKIRAMEIIAELETSPRGAYCGAMGAIAPGGDMRFNVAIRTLTLDGRGGFVCPVGSAIVADSRAREEYDECLLKAQFLTGATISA